MVVLAALTGVSACGGATSTASSGFGRECAAGPRIGGTAEFGGSDRGLVSDLEGLTIAFGGAACTGAPDEYAR